LADHRGDAARDPVGDVVVVVGDDGRDPFRAHERGRGGGRAHVRVLRPVEATSVFGEPSGTSGSARASPPAGPTSFNRATARAARGAHLLWAPTSSGGVPATDRAGGRARSPRTSPCRHATRVRDRRSRRP